MTDQAATLRDRRPHGYPMCMGCSSPTAQYKFPALAVGKFNKVDNSKASILGYQPVHSGGSTEWVDVGTAMRLLVIFLLTYSLLPLALGWLVQAISRWTGLALFEATRARQWALRVVWALSLLGGLVFLVLRLGTSVGYPGVLIGVAPFFMPALVICGALTAARRRHTDALAGPAQANGAALASGSPSLPRV